MATPRQAAREQMMLDIVRVGRTHLERGMPSELSLRAVARDLGVVPSALYRYVRNREDLLTLLIVDAYDALGDAVDAAVTAVAPDDHLGRLEAIAGAARSWAVAEPSRFALLYGTPVPGYTAPGERTVGPGTRVMRAIAAVLEDAYLAGALRPLEVTLSRTLQADMERLGSGADLTMPPVLLARVYGLWSAVLGAILYEIFDQHGPDTVSDPAEFFATHVRGLATTVGL